MSAQTCVSKETFVRLFVHLFIHQINPMTIFFIHPIDPFTYTNSLVDLLQCRDE